MPRRPHAHIEAVTLVILVIGQPLLLLDRVSPGIQYMPTREWNHKITELRVDN